MQHPGDENMWVKFHDVQVLNNFKTKQKGVPVFDTKTYVSIIVPGVDNTKVDRPMKDEDKDRFPKQWASYENRHEQPIDGMPLAEWPALHENLREELRMLKFYTVESIAAASDAQLQRVAGGFGLRERAKAFLEYAQDAASAQRHAEENAQLRSRIADLEGQVANLARRLEGDENAAPRKRGRPRKHPENVAA